MVKFIDKKNCYIGENARIGENTIIYPFVVIEGNCVIGDNCIIGPGSYLKNCTIGNNCSIYSSHVFDSKIADAVNIGPYAYIRNAVNVDIGAKIGTFVEIKKTDVGTGSRISHLSYVGDSTIGNNVNIGGGTITANFDGKFKNETIVDDNAFVGVNCSLIAPVKIGKSSVIGAGSTINGDVPDFSLGIARVRQENRINYYKN